MELLEKFAAVDIKPASRISEADQHFCEVHQKAYEMARSCFQELSYIWEDMCRTQNGILSEIETRPRGQNIYISSQDGLCLSAEDIQQHLKEMHTLFINRLVRYFEQSYHIVLSEPGIYEALVPQKEYRGWDHEAAQQYESTIANLSLQYDDVIEQIFLQTDGYPLHEWAIHELLDDCHQAAWNMTLGNARYEVKKETLRFPKQGCYYNNCWSNDHWQLTDHLKKVFKGIAYFETGDFSIVPHGMQTLMTNSSLDSDEWEFTSCQKVQKLKIFKNGRADIKFANEPYVKQFVFEYLGLVC